VPEPKRPTSPRVPRYVPKSKGRVRYYKASLVAGSVFVVLAVALPFWIDALRHRDVETVEATPDEAAPAAGAAAAAAVPAQPGSWVKPGVNEGCRAYVYARCNALEIPAGACATVADMAARVPREVTMDVCRKSVEAELSAAAAVHARRGPEAEAAEQAAPATPAVPATPAAEAATAGSGTDAEAAPGGPKVVTKTVLIPGEGPAPLPPGERAEKLDRLQDLVRDVQRSRSAMDFVLTPAAEQARLDEIRRIAEAEGSPEARALYESLRRAPPPPPPASPGGLPNVGHADTNAPAQTPEMAAAARISAAARKEAGLPPRPAAPVADPSRSMSPNEVPAASSPLVP